MAHKKDTRSSNKKKDRYRIRNWAQYNQSLKNRGSITFWFSPDVIKKWYAKSPPEGPGRPRVYADDAILCALMVKAVFHCKFRQLQGFIESLIKAMGLLLKCPDYSTFCRRAKNLPIPLSRTLKPGEHLHVVFDSTGLKVFGEGEWKTRKHGYSKRRTWRKLHVCMCANSGQIVVGALSTNDVSDGAAMLEMMEGLEEYALGEVYGDGAYDGVDCRMAIHDRGGTQIVPPPRNGVMSKEELYLTERNAAIKRMNEKGEEGRKQWKKEVGYHKRSRVETFMFRFKTIMGGGLGARIWENQVTEAMVKLQALNRMTELGMPESYKMAS